MRAVLFVALVLSTPDAGAPPVPNQAVYALEGDILGGEAEAVAEIGKWAKKAGATQLLIVVNSNGGLAGPALALFRAIKASPLPTRCEVRGRAISGAFLALQACTIRLMSKDAVVMTHRPAAVVKEQVITVEAAREMADYLAATATVMDALISERMRMPLGEYRAKVAGGASWFMTAPLALKHRAIDGILP